MSNAATPSPSVKVLPSPLEIERALVLVEGECGTEEELLAAYDVVDIVFMGNAGRLPPTAHECATVIGKLADRLQISPEEGAVVEYGRLQLLFGEIESATPDVERVLEGLRALASDAMAPRTPRMR